MIRKEDVRALKIIHLALCGGLSLFVILMAILVKNSGALLDLNKEAAYVLHTMVFMSFLTLVPLAYYLHGKKLKDIRSMGNPIEAYRNSVLLKLIMIEATGIVSGIIFLLTANAQILFIAAMGLVFLLINHPSQKKIQHELELDLPKQEEPEE